MIALEENAPSKNVVIEESRRGKLTLKVAVGDKMQYVHSKYDPEKDAERLVDKFDGNTNQHVLFVGIGIGYHLQTFIERYPNMKFSIYEPNEEVMLAYLSTSKLPLENLEQIFVGTESERLSKEIEELLAISKGKIQLLTLPIYEKIYGREIATIQKKAVETLRNKKNALAVNVSFQKRWTINAIKNFPTVLKTPNILHDVDKDVFKGKPAIIVAAGPSLNEEFESLRFIKENGLAYIFSVGSAINALIEHGIYPDAACTYDPSERNQFVIEKIKEKNIVDIPLIFGSSVGFETLEDYPGEMFHMITSQDTVSPQLLDTTQSIDIILDAPSIAVVTFQLLTQLECNPVMLVGQNLGYQNNQLYASGIQYDFIDNELSEEEKIKTLIVKDVYGHDIKTDEGFNAMRQQLEMHIEANRNIEVINTTKGGAQIEGTSFVELDDLIKGRLNFQVVKKMGGATLNAYDFSYVEKRIREISRDANNCDLLLKEIVGQLEVIHGALKNRRTNNMEQRFVLFDKEFNRLKRNSFYSGFVEPMLKVQNERLSEESQLIRYENNLLKKAEIVVESFGSFIQEVSLHVEFVKPYFEEMKKRIENRSNELDE
ncbi:motility associated factor glycosyltransferase family protein [Sporosarcina ureilytica]|nr:6-hydroxymethylpterin diphosphokinase MptE-like protein [Sporosarcina ureilytica]